MPLPIPRPNPAGPSSNMNGHAAAGVPNRAGQYRGQAINVGTTVRSSDPWGLTPANPKPNVSDKLAEITSRPSAPKISAKDATARDTRLHQESTTRNNIQDYNSYQHSVEQKIQSLKDANYAKPAQPSAPVKPKNTAQNPSTPESRAQTLEDMKQRSADRLPVGENPRTAGPKMPELPKVTPPKLGIKGFGGAAGGILTAIPALLEGGKIMSGQSNPNYIPKSQREG